MDLLTACRDPNLFAAWFRHPATWRSWFTFLRALFGQVLEGEDLELFTRCTGRAAPPSQQASEAWLICGRRSGKSFLLSLIAVYLATFKDWTPLLAPGEVGTVMVIATDRRQARTIMRYVEALLRGVPMLAALIARSRVNRDDLGFEIEGRVAIEIHTASFRTVRGYTIVAALLDELAFWKSEQSASPDTEVIEAIRPALATVPGSMLLAASSPYMRRGALWAAHRRYWAKAGPVLVWPAPTRVMNSQIGQEVVDEALERDASAAGSEWLATFRSDLESYVDRGAVEACVEPGVRERAPLPGVRYQGFCDPSGGRQDAMTMAIGHREGDVAVLDCTRERRPPFSPGGVVAEFAETLRAYGGVTTIKGDRYGGAWPEQEFRKHGVRYEPAERPKSDLYRKLLPLINSRRVELLDDPKLVAQLGGLERRVGRGGRDSIDHPPGAHDDLANACAGVLSVLCGPVALRPSYGLARIVVGGRS